jgi:hypothetical protein
MSIRKRRLRTLRSRHKQAVRPLLESLEIRLTPVSPSVHLNLHIFHPPIVHASGSGSGSGGIHPLDGGSPTPLGLFPADVRTAYGLDGIVGDGTGQTIAIPDAYDAPNFVNSDSPNFSSSDLAIFDQTFNLPDPPSFMKFNQTGGTTNLPGTDPSGAGNLNGTWEMEEALDIEWAHVLAPGASIDLVEANTDTNNNDLFQAVQTAASLPGVSTVSMSWGLDEYAGEQGVDNTFITPTGHQGVTFLAASGDSGSPGYYPAYSPNVLAVGGTTLTLKSDSSYDNEQAWAGSGGGTSITEAEPGYQLGVQTTGSRSIPDVAFDADPNTGVAILDSYDNTDNSGPWFQIGGTSLASPAWAGILAVVNQARVAQGGGSLDGPNETLPYLYQMSSVDFHDVTDGNNGGFKAGPGYDMVTGLGTPRVDLLVPDLSAFGTANQLVVSGQPPANVIVGSPFGVVATAEDSNGHIDPAYQGTVSIALATNPNGATLGGTTTVTASHGHAVFDGLTLNKVGTGYSFKITSADFLDVTSSAFNIIADPTPWAGTYYPAPIDNSLRAAITKAESDGHAFDNIVLSASAYKLTDKTAGQLVIQNSSSLPGKTLIFLGQGPANTIIEPGVAPWNNRDFELLGSTGSALNVIFQDLAIEGGDARDGGILGGGTALGGGVLIDGAAVTLRNVSVANNHAAGVIGQGGTTGTAGLGVAGTDGSVGGNAQGGGIYMAAGTLSLDGVTFSDNHALGGAGGRGGGGGSGVAPGHPSQNKTGGAGGNGATGGTGAGGGLYVAGGQVLLSGGAFDNNQAVGGAGGKGGAAGAGGADKPGGVGGNAGDAAPAAGGAIYLAQGSLTLANTTLKANAAIGGLGGLGGLGGGGGSALAGATGSVLGGSGFIRIHHQVSTGGKTNPGKVGADGGNGGPGGSAAAGTGGGIYVGGGTLTLEGVTLDGNQALGGQGGAGGVGGPGAIGSFGGISKSTFIGGGGTFGGHTGGTGGAAGSGAVGYGGGLYVAAGTVTLLDSTLQAGLAQGGQGGTGGTGGTGGLAVAFGGGIGTGGGGTGGVGGVGGIPASGGPGGFGGDGASGQGGGLYVLGGTVTLVNDTIASNAAALGNAGTGGLGGVGGSAGQIHASDGPGGAPGDATAGGLYVAGGSVTLDNATVALGNGGGGVGGVVQTGGTVVASSTLFAGNGTVDYSGNITADHSLFQTAVVGGTVSGSANLIGVDPRLDPAGLHSNGGPTQTISLLSGSPAFDVGANATGLLSDQRGAAPRTGPGGTDIGAVQHNAVADTQIPTVALSAPDVTTVNAAALNPYVFTVTFTDNVGMAAATLPGAVVTVIPQAGGAPLAATVVSTTAGGATDSFGDAHSFVVTFQVTPPGGAWSAADNGTYAIVLGGSAITDLAGNAAPRGPLGTFDVQIVVDHLVVTAQPPSQVTAGAPFTLTVKVEDAGGKVDASYSGGVTIALLSNPGNSTLGGTLTLTPQSGVATFTGLTLNIAAHGYTIQTTSTGLAAVATNPFDVVPAAAAKFVVSGFPTPTTAGIAHGFTVTAYDAYTNVATGYTGTVHFTSVDKQAAFSSDYTFLGTDKGTHSFTATLKTAGTQTIIATDTVTKTVTGSQVGIVVSPAALNTFTLKGFAPTTAGVGRAFTVVAQDAYGNTIPTYIGTVHFMSTDNQATLPLDYTFAPTDRGSHGFSATFRTAGPQHIQASDATAGKAGSAAVTINPAAASKLAVTGYLSPVTAGTSNTFIVTAYDPYNNVATGYTGTVHFTSSDGAASLPMDTTFGAVDAGQRSFSATLNTPGTQSITATDKAISTIKGTQAGISVTSLPVAASFVVAGFASPSSAGTAQTFTVTAKDGFGKIATGYAGTIHFTSSDPQAALPADYTFIPGTDKGAHTFTATLKTAGTRSITAVDTSNPALAASQSGITVNPAALKTFLVKGFGPTVAGTINAFTVTAQDAYGNTIPNYLGTVHFTSTDLLASLPPDYPFVASDNGTHGFQATLRTAGVAHIQVSDTSTGKIGSASVRVAPAAATMLKLTGYPSPVLAGTANTFVVTAYDAYGNVATGYAGKVTFGSDEIAAPPPDYMFTSADAGKHIFTATFKIKGTHYLTVTDTAASSLTGQQTGIVVQ